MDKPTSIKLYPTTYEAAYNDAFNRGVSISYVIDESIREKYQLGKPIIKEKMDKTPENKTQIID